MQYDVFICHASEDKDSFVRDLAEALRAQHVEVWYDEFTLPVGASIRQSIDRGLRHSRFGVVVLSPAFFAKQWPQYELDGLTEREISDREPVILPVWRNVSHADVLGYSPPLAGKRAITSSALVDVVRELLNVVRPAGSPLIVARDIAVEWGAAPPVVTDPRWLEAVEASNRVEAFGATVAAESSWSFWSFPLPPRASDPKKWGERLAWSYLQLEWTEAASRDRINLLTPPDEVHNFVRAYPGLIAVAESYPELLIDYAPQLTIRGFEGPFGDILEAEYRKACSTYEFRHLYSCPGKWAMRHPHFGGHQPETIARSYFNAEIFGPPVSPYEPADHIVWLLSSKSRWLPDAVRSVLLRGLATPRWIWFESGSGRGDWPCQGDLGHAIERAVDYHKQFRWINDAKRDLLNRIEKVCDLLALPESPNKLAQRFINAQIVQDYIRAAQIARIP